MTTPMHSECVLAGKTVVSLRAVYSQGFSRTYVLEVGRLQQEAYEPQSIVVSGSGLLAIHQLISAVAPELEQLEKDTGPSNRQQT